MTLSKNKIKYIHSLKDKKYRIQHMTFVAEGDKMVGELLDLLSCQLLVATPNYLKDIEPSILSKVEEVIEVSDQEIAKASFVKNPQQVIGVFYQSDYELIDSVWETQLCLALDGIQDPGNLGTIIRLADWYGIENIFCSKDTADLYNPKVVQSTMGAIARVKLHYLDLADFLSRINDSPIYGTFLDGESMYQSTLSNHGVVVMGNEGNGIRPEIECIISNKLFIPNYPFDRQTSESLNVAIATAIICAEFRRSKFNIEIKKS